ncbi:MAG: gluconokinase [Bacillota bacterium]|nr:gluconokinase [Bacillota bacterium]
MNYLIGVDIGTTSTKSIAFDLQGNILARRNIGYALISSEPSYSEQDPEEIFKAVVDSIRDVALETGRKGYDLSGIAFSSAMHSVIAVDKHGKPLTNSIIWADTRSRNYAADLKSSGLGHEIYMKTGTPIHPMSPLCKIAWMRDNLAEIYSKAYKFISIKEYVLYKLFGEYVIDYSIASATGLFDIYNLEWDRKALDFAGIDAIKLSRPVDTMHKMLGLRDDYREYMGIAADIPFIVGASDGCLANLGTNAIRPGEAAVTIGTSGAIRVISDKPLNDEEERIFSYILTEDRFVLGGPVNNGGIVLRWFRDNFGDMEALQGKESNEDPYDLLIDKAEKISAGSDGLIFLPYLLGERAPHWDANSKGVYFGINIKHSKAHFLRALLEGVIYGIYDVGRALVETTGDIHRIYATGGFVRSELWVQILADIFNKEVAIAESFESSCLGAAVLGMKSLNMIDSIDEVEKLVPVSKIFYPDGANHQMYSKLFKIYERLYGKLKDEFLNVEDL